MKQYKLSGKFRQVGAIGAFENFTRTVKAVTPKAAMDKNRAELYAQGYEHILHEQVKVKTGKTWQVIPMLKALGLE